MQLLSQINIQRTQGNTVIQLQQGNLPTAGRFKKHQRHIGRA